MGIAHDKYVFISLRPPARATFLPAAPKASARIAGRDVVPGRPPFAAMGDPLFNTEKNVLVGVVYMVWGRLQIELAARVAELCDKKVVRVLDAAGASQIEAYRELQLRSSVLLEVRWSDLPANTYDVVQQPDDWYYEPGHQGDIRFLAAFGSSPPFISDNDGVTFPTELGLP